METTSPPAAPAAPPKVYMPAMPGAMPGRARPQPRGPRDRPAATRPAEERKGFVAPTGVSTSPFG